MLVLRLASAVVREFLSSCLLDALLDLAVALHIRDLDHRLLVLRK